MFGRKGASRSYPAIILPSCTHSRPRIDVHGKTEGKVRLDGFITRAGNSWMRYLNHDQKENMEGFYSGCIILGKDWVSDAIGHVQSARKSGWKGMRSVGSMVLDGPGSKACLMGGIEARSQRPRGKKRRNCGANRFCVCLDEGTARTA